MTLKWLWHAWTSPRNRQENHIHIHSHKPSSACTWKPPSEIGMMRAYSNHHQLFLEAPTKWGMKPEQKMQISQSLSSRNRGNTRRKSVARKAMPLYRDPLSQHPSFPAERGTLPDVFKKKKKTHLFHSKIPLVHLIQFIKIRFTLILLTYQFRV